jgi:two-component system sensor histidine kinase PilS (NtrC family)
LTNPTLKPEAGNESDSVSASPNDDSITMTDPLPERRELDALLRGFGWTRLGAAGLLAIIVPYMPTDLMPRTNTGILLFVLPVVVASSAALLLGVANRPRRTAWYLCLLDVVLITAAVAATGSARSILAFLYVLLVTAASVLLSRAGGLVIGGLSSTLYASLVFLPALVPPGALLDIATGEALSDATALDVLTVIVNTGTLLFVAIVAGGLAARALTTRQELETRRKDLRDLQAFKDLVFQSVGTGLIALDRDHVITAFNRVAEALTGIPPGKAIGRPWPVLLGNALPLGSIEAAITNDPTRPVRCETELGRPDGTRVPVRVTCSPLTSGDAERVGLIVACEDLSALRIMEARIRQADRLATLGRLSANIAHEIRNPLASLTGAIEALTGGTSLGEERERLTQIVLRESERLNQMIKAFLDYARPTPLTTGDVDVAQVVEEVLVLLEHRELPPGLKIVREIPPALTWQLDQHRFRQALWNLCLNAVQAMPAGGELTVSVSADDPTLRIAVSDTGEGIAPADLGHVFEPFFSTKPGGSGLGLALVHRVVHEHGGDIEVRSAPELGTTFVLTLPAREAAIPEAARA